MFEKFTDKAKSMGVSGVGNAVTGLSSLAMNIFGNSGIEKDSVGNRMTTDLYGRPVFSSNAYQGSIDTIRDDAKSQIGTSLMSGAASGAQIGTAIAPGIGTAIGAVGGAIGGLIGGRRRKKQMMNEVRNRETMLDKSITSFNTENRNFFESDAAASANSFALSERSRRVGY